MTPVGKAVWFVETRLGQELTLAEVAAQAGVSRFHLSRAFGAATGVSLMRYLRGRRLTQAARALAGGARDILAVALDAGYGSHEAFTRAFREQFGRTPEAVRAAGLDGINLMEAMPMDEGLDVAVAPPRFEQGPVLLIAGLGARYSFETNGGIPAQWQDFVAMLPLPGQVGRTAYGVCCNADGTGQFDYIAGVEVQDFARLPAELARIRLAARRYAVFTHAGHVSGMRATVHSIWNRYLPASGLVVADAPDFERYGPAFDGRTGLGGVEIWIPVQE